MYFNKKTLKEKLILEYENIKKKNFNDNYYSDFEFIKDVFEKRNIILIGTKKFHYKLLFKLFNIFTNYTLNKNNQEIKNITKEYLSNIIINIPQITEFERTLKSESFLFEDLKYFLEKKDIIEQLIINGYYDKLIIKDLLEIIKNKELSYREEVTSDINYKKIKIDAIEFFENII